MHRTNAFNAIIMKETPYNTNTFNTINYEKNSIRPIGHWYRGYGM